MFPMTALESLEKITNVGGGYARFRAQKDKTSMHECWLDALSGEKNKQTVIDILELLGKWEDGRIVDTSRELLWIFYVW